MSGNGVAPPLRPSEQLSGTAILAIAGSSRRGSLNKRLLDVAIRAAVAVDADVSILDLRDLDLPVYDPDIGIEAMPQGVLALRQIASGHDALLIATPEYNGSVPPLLKNALDWSTCPAFGERRFAPYQGKLATLMSVSNQQHGGVRGLSHLRSILCQMGVLVLPDELSVSSATATVNDPGSFDAERDRVRHQISQLVGTLRLCFGEGSPS